MTPEAMMLLETFPEAITPPLFFSSVLDTRPPYKILGIETSSYVFCWVFFPPLLY